MDDDLISRKELRKAFKESGYFTGPWLHWARLLIDIAPTVKRPQGRWIDTGHMEEYWAEEYQCPICGEKDHWHNFCPHCGADMRKEI